MSDQQYTHLLRVITDMADTILATTKVMINESEVRIKRELTEYMDRRFRQSDNMHHEDHQQILSAVSDVIFPMQREIKRLASLRSEP